MSALSEIGQALKEARERRGKTLDHVAAETHIHLRHLQALEAGDESALPEPFYVKFFIRKYATAVDLAGEELATKYWDTRPLPPLPEPTPERGMPSWLVPVLALVVVIGLGGVGWYAVRHHQAQAPVAVVPEASPTVGPPEAPAHLPPTAKPGKHATKASPKPGAKAVAKASASATAAASGTVVTASAGPTVGVIVHARQDSWLEFTRDGQKLYSDVLKAGRTEDARGKVVEVVIGNAAGVDVKVEGKDQGVLGKKGEVVDRVYKGSGK